MSTMETVDIPVTLALLAPHTSSSVYEMVSVYWGVICVFVTLAYTFYLYRIRTPSADFPYVAGMFLCSVVFAVLTSRIVYQAGEMFFITRIIAYIIMFGLATWWMWCLRGEFWENLRRFFLKKPRFSRVVATDDTDETSAPVDD